MLHIVRGLAIAAVRLSRASAAGRSDIIRRWSRQLLAVLDIRLIVHGNPPDCSAAGAVFVANHVSWLDIQAIHSVHAVRFIAKHEIGDWPVFGRLAACAGTVFIERTRRHEARRTVAMLTERLRAGDCICFFPEGTTSDGSTVRPFKSSLLQAAIDARAPVRPVAISYTNADGSINRQMAYFDEMSLWESLKRVLAQSAPTVTLHFLPAIDTDGLERQEVSAQARQAIAQALGLAY